MVRGIYSAIYGEVNVSVSGGYVLQCVGGTCASGCFICATIKRWSGRKIWALLHMIYFLGGSKNPHVFVQSMFVIGKSINIAIYLSQKQHTHTLRLRIYTNKYESTRVLY